MLPTSEVLSGILPVRSVPPSRFSSVTDGLSNTMMFAEIAGGPIRFNRKLQAGDQNGAFGHFGNWNRLLLTRVSDDGTTLHGGNCLVNCTNWAGLNLFSFHPGVAQIALADDVGGNTAATPIDLGDGEFLVSSLIRPADGPAENAATSNRKMNIIREGDRWELQTSWIAESARGGFCSPIADAECCYWLNPVGVLFCLDRESGREHYARRLSCGPCWATPLVVGDRLYLFGKDGETVVARSGTAFELVSEANSVWPEDEPSPEPAQLGQAKAAQNDPIQAAPTLYSVLAIDGALIFRRGDCIYRVNHR
jgi:outer membrane protein assembly factor BamB